MSVTIEVPGVPVAQGSKTAASRNGHAWVRDSNAARLGPWRSLVALAASTAMNGRPLMTGPLSVRVALGFPRPKSHRDSRGSLRPLAPYWRDSTPDVDKCLRALFDALTGVVWTDDRLVVDVRASKTYMDPPVTRITVERAP